MVAAKTSRNAVSARTAAKSVFGCNQTESGDAPEAETVDDVALGAVKSDAM